jgi:hypothetical protein
MVDEGASTLNARSAVERTVTLPNHTGMLTGRRVGRAGGHHITVNVDTGGTVHDAAGSYRASLFDVVHDRGGRTALFASKDKFALFDRTWGPYGGAPDRVGADDGRDKIDRYVFHDDPDALATKLVRQMRRDNLYDATFLHVRLPDSAGHAHGFMGAAYLDAVRRSDRIVGRVMKGVEETRYGSTVDLVVTADHGGSGSFVHDDRDDVANYRVPLLVWGPDARPGASLYGLNPERVPPGNGRPGYGTPPIRNTDVASLATTLLGLPAVPGGLLPGTSPLEVS